MVQPVGSCGLAGGTVIKHRLWCCIPATLASCDNKEQIRVVWFVCTRKEADSSGILLRLKIRPRNTLARNDESAVSQGARFNFLVSASYDHYCTALLGGGVDFLFFWGGKGLHENIIIIIIYLFIYLAGCTTFLHLPAPI